MRAAEPSRLRRLLSSDDSDRQRGVAKPITVPISATQTPTPDVDMSNNRRSPSLMSTSMGADHPWLLSVPSDPVITAFYWRLASKTYILADWLLCRDVTRHGFVVMHAVSRFLRIFMRAEKQACKQLQCNKAKLLESTCFCITSMDLTIKRV